MSRKRKSMNVKAIKDHANTFFRLSANSLAEQRRGVASLLETILMASGNYNGFRYLVAHEVEPGFTVGMTLVDGKPDLFPDESRVAYY